MIFIQTTTTTSVTSTISTVLTCYSSVDFANVAVTECAATARRRKRDIVIDDAPPAYINHQKKNVETEADENNKEESHENSYEIINPSRTTKSSVPLMTMESHDKADMKEKNYEDQIPFIPTLEVIRYIIKRKK